MRFFLMILVTILLLPALAFAQAADNSAVPEGNEPLIGITRGSLPSMKQIVPRTPSEAELQEANAIFRGCADNDRESSYYDCECISLNFLQQRLLDQRDANDNPTASPFLKARKSCPNPTGIAGMTYSRCLSWAPRLHSDYEVFCTCYANDYAKRFAYNPTSKPKINQIMMESSMNQCNAGQPVVDKMLRNQQIEYLKKQGRYEELFPSAKSLNQPLVPPDPYAATRRKTAQQKMQESLSAPDTGPRRTER